MALVVEDGTGQATADAYISIAECDTYHTDRGHSTWSGTDAEKQAAIRLATGYIDGHYGERWPGYRTDDDQALDWPRYEAYDRDGWEIDHNAVPQAVKYAACEAALRALTGELAPDLDRGGAIASQTVGPITTNYQPGAPATTRYRVIDHHLRRIVGGSGSVRVKRV